MKLSLNLSFPIIIFSIFFFLACPKSVSVNEGGWILTQRSKVFGNQYLYINSHGVKCINPKQGVGWVTQSPNWTITFFNEKTSLYYPLSSASWKRKIAQNGFIPSNISWSKVKSGSICGLKASEYEMANNPNSGSINIKSKWSSATYWLADEINVPANLSQLISSACALPESNSVPLQLTYRNQQGQTETLLSTYHQQTCAIPDSYFSNPRNFKLAKSEVEILMSKENRSLLNELADDLSHDNGDRSSTGSQQNANPSINKLPDQLTLPGGKTITKQQVSNFLNKLKQNQ